MGKRIARLALFTTMLVVLVWGGIHRTQATLGEAVEASVSGEAYGAGQTTVRATEWFATEGTVSRVDSGALLIQTADRGAVLVEGESWAFAQSQQFTARKGDLVSITGFDEAGEFKAGRLHNQTTGQGVLLRDDNGWPYWSNRYQR
jgi:membrane protein implicated in regulation of membrane protease activity